MDHFHDPYFVLSYYFVVLHVLLPYTILSVLLRSGFCLPRIYLPRLDSTLPYSTHSTTYITTTRGNTISSDRLTQLLYHTTVSHSVTYFLQCQCRFLTVDSAIGRFLEGLAQSGDDTSTVIWEGLPHPSPNSPPSTASQRQPPKLFSARDFYSQYSPILFTTLPCCRFL